MTALLLSLMFFGVVFLTLASVLMAMFIGVLVSDWISDLRNKREPLPKPGKSAFPRRTIIKSRNIDWISTQ